MKIGDVVRLRSGGPQMTVTRIAGVEDRVHVAWFRDDNGATPAMQDYFPAPCLTVENDRETEVVRRFMQSTTEEGET